MSKTFCFYDSNPKTLNWGGRPGQPAGPALAARATPWDSHGSPPIGYSPALAARATPWDSHGKHPIGYSPALAARAAPWDSHGKHPIGYSPALAARTTKSRYKNVATVTKMWRPLQKCGDRYKMW